MAKSQNSQQVAKVVGKIDKVDPARVFNDSTGGKWKPIIAAFNPFGTIAALYAQTLVYKIEVKRLEIEKTRIEEQARIAADVIDKTFKLKVKELTHRRIGLKRFYKSVNKELQRLHIERVKVLEMAEAAQQKSFEDGLSIEERQLFKEMATEMIRELPRFGDKANESLQQLVQVLPPVEIPPKLLDN